MKWSTSSRRRGFTRLVEHTSEDVLSILDDAARAFVFPMLDNGYVYPAASRLKLYRSPSRWGIVFETFGYSPRAGVPDLLVTTFTNDPVHQKTQADYVTDDAYQGYLASHQQDVQCFIHPIQDDGWIDPEDSELVSETADSSVVRGRRTKLPEPDQYAAAGVRLEQPRRIWIYELCRALAFFARDDVLATADESRQELMPDLTLLLTLDQWHHPDVVDDEALPSRNETMRQLVDVITTGDVSHYAPTQIANNHWSNWPNGGTL